MTFKNCIEYFPIGDTFIGSYNQDEMVDPILEISFGNMPGKVDESAISFVVYNEEKNTLEYWYYGFWRVEGYINETYDTDEFYPAIYNDDSGWEKIDPDNTEDIIFVPDDEFAMEIGYDYKDAAKWEVRCKQIAYNFSPELYKKGHIFLTYDEFDRFMTKNFPNE